MKTSANTEHQVAFRDFLKQTFGARIAVDEEGATISRVKGKKARAEITNVQQVVRRISKQAKLIKETPTRLMFEFGKGKKRATISVAHVGDADVLTMRTM